jgi:hypothetical protein
MRYARALAALLFLCAASHALALDRVTFATNWLAEAEHGGFYQALTDGTYERYGLDVKIIQGGPQLNNQLLLAAGRVDFYLGASGAVHRRQELDPTRLCHVGALRGRAAGRFQAQRFPARRLRLRQLFDDDRNARRSRRAKA